MSTNTSVNDSYDIKNLSDFANLLVKKTATHNKIPKSYYDRYEIKRGLRNADGTGVYVGLTAVSNVIGYKMVDHKKIPIEGQLIMRGYDLNDLLNMTPPLTFEAITYLLLIGELPTKQELEGFNKILDLFRALPNGYTENMILKIPSVNIMNKLQRSILVLYSHDHNPESLQIDHLLEQCMKLIARFPTIISHSYQAKAHYFDKKSLYLHSPQDNIGTARNILHMIRPDSQYSELEAQTLDLMLILHADHGGGNNSAFATHVVSSSGTDTYSAIATAVGSLKGTKHGGANSKVKMMMQDIKAHVSNIKDENQVKKYLHQILNKDAFDQSGLIYGIGHAVYTISDPRSIILKKQAKILAEDKGFTEEYEFYSLVEKLAIEAIHEKKGPSISLCANVDLYSGLVYNMLGIPDELYTPLFASSRVAGWCSHRIEQVLSDDRIIRPAYICVESK